MNIAVIPLPSLLPREPISMRSVVVIDVIRATTTIPRALAAGARQVRICGDLDGAREAHGAFEGPKALAGERECLRPPGFDLGNSPDEMTPEAVGGRTLFLTTTNGTRAIGAAHGHPRLLREAGAGGGGGGGPECFVASLVNAGTTADRLLQAGRDVVLLCAGSDGELAEEDLVGAGAILARLRERAGAGIEVVCDQDQEAEEWFGRFEREGVQVLKRTQGGRKLIGAGLGADLTACAALDDCPVVCIAEEEGVWVRREGPPRT